MKKTYILIKSNYGRNQVARIIKDVFRDCSSGMTKLEIRFPKIQPNHKKPSFSRWLW